MKKFFLSLALGVALSHQVIAQIAPGDAGPKGPQQDAVVGRIGHQEVKMSDMAPMFQMMAPYMKGMKQEDLPKLFALVRDQMLNTILVTEEAKGDDSIKNDPAVQQRIEKMRDTILAEEKLRRVSADAASESRIKAEYTTYKNDLQKKNEREVRARLIFTANKKDADNIIAELKDGASFEALARKKSILKPLAERDGDMGYVRKEALPDKALAESVFEAKVGDLPKKPVKVASGNYALVYVIDSRKAQPENFEKMAPALQQKLVMKARLAYFKELTAKAQKKGVKIEYYTMDGKTDKPSELPDHLSSILGRANGS